MFFISAIELLSAFVFADFKELVNVVGAAEKFDEVLVVRDDNQLEVALLRPALDDPGIRDNDRVKDDPLSKIIRRPRRRNV